MEKREYLKEVKAKIEGLKRATTLILKEAQAAESEKDQDAILDCIDFAQQELWARL